MDHASVHRFAAIRTLALAGLVSIGLVPSTAVPALAGRSGTWTKTGSLNVARGEEAATLLPNGQVLVAGGADYNWNGYASAELYNPFTGKWTFTGSMNSPRLYHTATLLPNGQVLVVGGSSNLAGWPPPALASAELYNPSTGTWTTTGSLKTGRWGHIAVLLTNGKVVVVGGEIPNGAYTPSAELYDPSTGKWATTGSLNDPRAVFTLTLLSNGQVLVAGGNDVNGLNGYASSAEL